MLSATFLTFLFACFSMLVSANVWMHLDDRPRFDLHFDEDVVWGEHDVSVRLWTEVKGTSVPQAFPTRGSVPVGPFGERTHAVFEWEAGSVDQATSKHAAKQASSVASASAWNNLWELYREIHDRTPIGDRRQRVLELEFTGFNEDLRLCVNLVATARKLGTKSAPVLFQYFVSVSDPHFYAYIRPSAFGPCTHSNKNGDKSENAAMIHQKTHQKLKTL